MKNVEKISDPMVGALKCNMIETNGDTRRRILVVLGSLGVGGTETWFVNVVRRTRMRVFQYDFLLHSHQSSVYESEVMEYGCRVFRCDMRRKFDWYRRDFPKLVAEAGGYHAIHCNPHHFSALPLFFARQVGIPVRICHSHLDDRPLRRNNSIIRTAMLMAAECAIRVSATHRVACSSIAGEALYGRRWSRGNNESSIIRCGLDYTRFKHPVTGDIRSELGLHADTLLVSHVGRFYAQKNHRLIVSLAESLCPKTPQLHFLLVGTGPEFASIAAIVREKELTENVHFLGERHDVHALLRQSDAFVFPSLCEGLGLAALEAQAAGLPCVLSDGVPSDAAVCSDLVQFVPLDAPIEIWADALMQGLSRGKGDVDRNVDEIMSGPFGVDSSVAALERLYAS